MSFLGMGTMEVFVVLLVAFIFLGPARMIETGKSLGRTIRQLRRMSADLSESWLDEEDFSLVERPKVHRSGGRAATPDHDESGRNASDEQVAEPDGPVAFRQTSGYADDDASPPGSERPAT